MKKCCYLIIVLLLVSTSMFSQSLSFSLSGKGVIGGLNFANVTGDDTENANILYRYAIGGFVQFEINDIFSVRPELFYSAKGFDYFDEGSFNAPNYESEYSVSQVISFNFIEVPVIAIITVYEDVNFITGPYIDFFLNGEEDLDYFIYENDNGVITEEEGDFKEDIKSNLVTTPGFGLVFGFEYNYDKFIFSGRYSMGLSNIPESDDQELKHSIFQILVAYNI